MEKQTPSAIEQAIQFGMSIRDIKNELEKTAESLTSPALVDPSKCAPKEIPESIRRMYENFMYDARAYLGMPIIRKAIANVMQQYADLEKLKTISRV